MISFIKEQKINLALLLIAICLGSFISAGEKVQEYAILIKLIVIVLMFVLCKCLYMFFTFKSR